MPATNLRIHARRQAGRLGAMVKEVIDRFIGPRPPQAPPDRILQAIRAQDARSEVLVCYVQFAAIAVFAFLYTLTPKAFPEMVPFEPVPWALLLYAIFTGIRLRLALQDRLSRGFLYLSVVIDLLVLMSTIWSFHLQYQVSPATYLKAPTLMYVFILIALRALRLEAELVLFTGVAGAFAWLVLLAYAYWMGAGQITHNFVEYANTDALLLGAEFDKIVSILVVAGILAIGLARARRLLIAAVVEEQEASELSRYFAPEIARRIRAHGRTGMGGGGMVRDAVVLMIDLRGFTATTARLSPNDTISLIADYHDAIVPVIQRHGGSIDKYLGDGILASFGAVVPAESFAADAMRAAEEICATGQDWCARRNEAGQDSLDIMLAAACGPVLSGPLGHRSRLEYTVMGEPVNLASKLEKHTRQEQVHGLTTLATYEQALQQGYRPARAGHVLRGRHVAGIDDPQDLYVLG
ncbi:adenylate/guanylate cyclase domain-containing protein [Geminicoccus roseus]|uniref:adenylate/guanylate cyclase domain-containing protein n=1 Tax=Geminicoccus roseus TaxID=404900 RepID=UPI00041BFC06|nr:adenylate/guanylate cyclase domain-containing protein [Geminicoccus roseus]